MTKRFGFAAALACAGLALAPPAHAQTVAPHGWALDRFEPSSAGDLFFAADRPWYSGSQDFSLRFGLIGDYAHLPLSFRFGDQGSAIAGPVVENMLVGHLQIGVAFLDRIGVNLSIPVSLWQGGNDSYGIGPAPGPAIGDPRIGTRVRIVGQTERDAFSLHFGASLFFNGAIFGVHTTDNTTDNQFRARFQLTGAGRVSILKWSAGLGFHLRPTQITVGNAAVGNEVFFNAAVGFTALEERLTIGPELFMGTNVDHAFEWTQWNAELMLGAHYLIDNTVLVGLGAGPGLSQGEGTPQFRVLLQVAYAPEGLHRPPPRPGDRDGDGVLDADDVCPDEPRGDHPDIGRLGCPQRDTDHDGVFDDDDRCPTAPAGSNPDPERRGCPRGDQDGDGVRDEDDQCPTVPTGDHPDPERRGCPDGDTDGDGVLDHVDQCTLVPQGDHPDPSRPGCPIPDRDHDTVPDAVDHCPDQPGAPSTNPRRNGCPGLVQVEHGVIRLIQPVFFATNRDVILPRSFPVLTAVADVLRAQPEIDRVSIEGHTDDVGDDARNLDLSQRRATSVMRWLMLHGIDAGRLEAHGFGETHPIQPIGGLRGRTLSTARSANRRVEFRIVRAATSATTATPTAGQ